MKYREKAKVVLSIKENIEMELFSSEERCVVIQTQEEDNEKQGLHWRHQEHPLVQDTEDDQGCRSQNPGRKLSKQASAKSECQGTTGSMEETLIEMEVLQSLRKSQQQTEQKASRLKWKRLTPQKSRFVVKDVVCLPRDQYLAQMESCVFSQRKEVCTSTARITVDHCWSAAEMDSRLRMVFRREFGKAAARRMTFTYLQCVQSSKALFVPVAPAEGWTGAHVIQISSQGPLYVLIHQDPSQVECWQPSFSKDVRKVVCLDTNKETKHKKINPCSEEHRLELQGILAPVREAPDLEIFLQVKRTEVLPAALKAVRKSGFCCRTAPLVTFTGEDTAGHQGPLREFFRLTLQELQKTSLFEGQPGRLFLSPDLSALEDWRYYEAGVLIGWSLVHGGPGPRCLHPALYQLMCGHSALVDDFSWRDVVDIEIQSHLQQLQTCSDVTLLTPGVCEWVLSCGIPEISSASKEEIPLIHRRVVKHYIYDRVSEMISQFTEGLNSCSGLWDMMKSHWEAFAPVMTSVYSRPLTLADFTQLFTVRFSLESERLKTAEEETVTHWETALRLISDGHAAVSFEDLLTFISGADHLPPLGFSSCISLCFYSQDTAVSCVRLPFASTCTLELFLPRAVGGASELLGLLTRAVQDSVGFTCLKAEGVDCLVGPNRM